MKQQHIASSQFMKRVDTSPRSVFSIEKTQILELIAENVATHIAYLDKKGRFIYTNTSFRRWYEMQEDDLIGRYFREVKGVIAYKYLKPYLLRALAGERVSYEFQVNGSDGAIIIEEITFIPHKDEKNNVTGVLLTIVDISASKQTESMKESEKQLRRFIDANVIGVMISSLDGPLIEANDIFLDMVGYSRTDLKKGKINWKNMTPTEYLFISNTMEKELLEKGSCKPIEKEYIRKDGRRIPVLIGDVLLDKATRRAIAFVLDMTKQHELQDRKDEFIALASHELKTPLTSLKLYAGVMERVLKQSGDKVSEELFTKMNKQIDNVNELLASLLDVSRLQSGKLQYIKTKFSIKLLIAETVQELQKVTNTHQIIFKGNNTEKISADRNRMKQVLYNLITNAIKYSPNAKNVIVSLKKKDNVIQISVKDFGIGIDKAHQKQIFNRYFQINDADNLSRSGLGLGLYLSKEIIQQHKGSIWQKSKLGEGSTFYFTLPIQ